MTELLTAAQMRAIEQAAIDSGEATGLELMERAGRGVVEAIFEEWPALAKTSHRAVVLCGPGNNGGDGFVVARLLKEWGWEVEVFLYGDPEKLPPDAKVNYERWGILGHVKPLGSGSSEEAPNEGADLLYSNSDIFIDALFGTGITRPVPKLPPVREFMSRAFGNNYLGEIDEELPRVVAVDFPSGLCTDSGEHLRPNPSVRNRDHFAHLTVAFSDAKIGHYLSDGPLACGSLSIKPIGLEHRPRPEGGGDPGLTPRDLPVRLVEPPFPGFSKVPDTHKYSHGHALILSGGPGKTGAARLAARGAIRIGAGLVTIGCPRTALDEVAAQTTAVMCRKIDGAPGLTELLEDDRFNALGIGPGLGLGPDTQALVLAALKSDRRTVLDADALTRFERNPDVLFDALHENCVLTPHAGEFKRLFPDISEKLTAPATTGPAFSKVDATRDAAARAGCTILFKGPDTVIADQSGRCSINSSAYERAAPWLATAGSGDVLTGFVAGLLARGFSPMKAAETSAWMHTECALSFGPGLIAEDLPEEIPKVFRALGV